MYNVKEQKTRENDKKSFSEEQQSYFMKEKDNNAENLAGALLQVGFFAPCDISRFNSKSSKISKNNI